MVKPSEYLYTYVYEHEDKHVSIGITAASKADANSQLKELLSPPALKDVELVSCTLLEYLH